MTGRTAAIVIIAVLIGSVILAPAIMLFSLWGTPPL